MKKDVTMRKNSLINGALISTIAIIITKILGVLYVIPFHSIIGDEGGALYGYAYTIYLFFISISTAGIPLAISRVVAEYQSLGYYKAKKRAFVLGKRIALILGVISFLLIILFAPMISKLILGDVVGGNSIKEITYVIRMIGIAILIVPVLSIYRGYFEGHRFMNPPSISQILEQLFRVLVIVFGSIITLKLFNASITTAVGVALLGASIGAFISYFYLLQKYINNKSRFNEKLRSVNQPLVKDKDIIKKLLYYAIPFIMIDVCKSLYNYIDMFTVVKSLVKYANYSAVEAESIYSILSTWCNKFNMIILAVSSGVIVSLIPNLTESIVRKNDVEISKKITQSINMLLYLTIPMTIGLSFLAKPIWVLFYGYSFHGVKIFQYFIYVGLITGLFTCLITIIQTFKDYKSVFLCLIVGVLVKLILNVSLLRSFVSIGFAPYYGFITSTIIGYVVSIIMCFILLYKKYKIKLEDVLKSFIDILCGSLVMLVGLMIVRFFVPVSSNTRALNILIIIFYAIVGASIYLIYAHFSKLSKNVFGNSMIRKIRRILLKR